MAITHPYPSSLDRAHTMHTLDWIAMVLMIIGGIDLGLVGLANFNLITSLFGVGSGLSRFIFVLVGLAALYGIYMAVRWGGRNHHT
jgi:uncharacterized membrane protein YuzA (DUF378 family)